MSAREPIRRHIPASSAGPDTRKGKARTWHTLGLVVASVTGATQLAGISDAHAAERITYQWGDVEMVAQRAGQKDGIRVIFIHGTPGSSGAWEDFLADVPEGFEYIAVDRAGFGDSGPDDAVTSIRAQAEAIAPLLDHQTGGRGGAIIVGHSLGGPVAVMLGILRPDAVHGLVVVAGSLDPSLEEIHFMQPVGEWWGVRHVLPRTIRNANRELMVLERELADMAPLLARLSAPVEIVHGTEDNLTPFQNVSYMETHMTATPLTVTVLEGHNHFLPWNASGEIEDAILRAKVNMKPPTAGISGEMPHASAADQP